MAFFSLRENMMIETDVIIFEGGRNNRVIWLISLNKDVGSIKVPTTDPTNNLGQ